MYLYLVAAAVWVYVLVFYGLFKGTRCLSPAWLKGKTVVVTGSNTGIGKSTALELAKRGARVILACRNKEKAEAAVFDIRSESGNPQVVFMQLDLASLKSVRSFAETFLKTEPRLDILINNAGVLGPGCTEEGFDLAFGVNHLGHFLLTNLLLERLRLCGPSRVITVSALLHRIGSIDFQRLAPQTDAVPPQSAWSSLQAYCNSKLCNVLFTRELANRLEGTDVTCYTLHPGVIYTELCRNLSQWLQLLMMPLAKLFLLDPSGGCQTTLYCALQEGIEPLSGRYFSSCALQQVGANGRDDGLAKKLWEVSERLTGMA
ncbi:PREDICTED: dehydrogenase/reductase SDR family member 13-like isoform X2 [Poecilia mexicana]|uniref:Dehydrogenase/reductase (SDR family) member 13a, duplicate 3 n=2 Tax=Poecilia TaxID=8080 RepID=A0A087XNA9_POEFO|nr:PREDICTED: dehydrogenase/reductase SDR family member 13-like isoform X2 [Poecilia formosa]XP_014868096.1 PREDICTED: dehydrogenase/reductase SDR family member 13-like isoform X2 [Poecilia mexicana]